MTGHDNATATAEGDVLLDRVRTLKKAPILQRGDAAIELAVLTVAVIRRLEKRISKLEDRTDDEAQT